MLSSHRWDAYGFGDGTAPTDDPYANFGAQHGYYRDATGLLLTTFRYYDPAHGRFLTRDPIGYAGGLHLYAYSNNNPVNFADPLGLNPNRRKDWIDHWGDFSAGMGDVLSFGLTSAFNNWTGAGQYIDTRSGAYLGGQIAGIAVSAGRGAAVGAARGGGALVLAAKQGAKSASNIGANQARGKAYEASFPGSPNYKRCASATGTARYRVPDRERRHSVWEIKGGLSITLTNQIRDEIRHASTKLHRRYVMVVRPGAQVSSTIGQYASRYGVKVRIVRWP